MKKTVVKGALESEMEQLMTPEAIKELGTLTPTIQQFLLRWQDKRDLLLGEELKKELKDFLYDIHIKDNDELVANVSEVVVAQNRLIHNSIDEISKVIKDIADDIKAIKLDINDIKKRLHVVEDKMEEMEERVARLEHEHKWYIVALKILTAVLLSVLAMLGIHKWFL